MTDPTIPDEPPALLQTLDQERAAIAAGTATACGSSCACHGAVECLRAVHPHDSDADMGVDDNGRPRPRGNVHPHVGYDSDGNLVQWEHTDAHGPVLTADDVAEQAAEARREHTRALLGTLDLDVLRELLGG